MVHVSRESDDETRRRLLRVLPQAQMETYDGAFCFQESSIDDPPVPPRDCVAIVRNDRVWSALVPASSGSSGEVFGLVRFAFPGEVDNSGFVGWLATHLKRALGTGVFVVCGYDSDAGGVFDYWGFPFALRGAVLREIDSLRSSGAA